MVQITRTESNSHRLNWQRTIFRHAINSACLAKVNSVEAGFAIGFQQISGEDYFDSALVAVDTTEPVRAYHAAIDTWMQVKELYDKVEAPAIEAARELNATGDAANDPWDDSKQFVASNAPLKSRLARIVFDNEAFEDSQCVWAARTLAEITKHEAQCHE